MSEPREMHVLRRTLDIDAPPSEVWRVLTTPELVREWAAAYQDGISIRTSWREGDRVTWRAPNGKTRAAGTVAAFQPEKLLKFVYDEPGDVAPETRSFDAFEISECPMGARLRFSTGPLDPARLQAIEDAAEQAIQEIKSLAEESAQIHGVR